MQASVGWQPPAPEELQRDFPLYEIRGILGRGGMGAVYKGWQKSLDRFVAIKILPPGLDDGSAGFSERFKREAKAMAQLQHPGIVAVFDAGTTSGGLLYFVMECITGTDMQRLAAERGRLDPAEALRITSAVCDALGYAHEHGLIHRDIKPSNIMLDARGTVKVADFGLAKSTAPETTMLTMSSVAMGTPDFMAPEAFKGVANVDHRADIYAVGVMLYQMLTGEVPRVMFKLPSRCRPELGMRFDALICKALETDPADRFQSAAEMRRELDAVAGALNAKPSVPVQRRGVPKLAYAALAAVIALAVGGWFFFGRGHGPAPAAKTIEPDAVKVPDAAAASSQTPSRNEWIRLLETPEAVTRSGIKNPEWKDGWLTVSPERLYLVRLAGGKDKVRDMAFRATVRPPANEWPITAILHAGADPQYNLDVHHDRLTLRRVKQVAASKPVYTQLGNVPLDLRQAKDGAFKLEGSIQGNLITIMADGVKVIEVRDEGAAGAGDIILAAPSEANGSGKIKDLAFRLLDDAQSKVIAVNGPAPEPGAIKLWDTPDKIPKQSGVRWEDGALILGDEKSSGMLAYASPRSRDAIIRADIHTNPDAEYAQLRLRFRGSQGRGNFYRLQLHQGTILLSSSVLGDSTDLRMWHLPRTYGPDEWARLELRAVGDELTVSLDGLELGSVHDSSQPEAGSVMAVANANGWFRNVTYVPLDKAGAAQPPGQIVDLLPLLDVKRDTITGSWKIENGALATNKTEGQNFIRLPAAPGGGYDLHLRLRREETSGTTAVHFALTHAGHGANLLIDGVPNPRIGLEHVAGKSMSANGTSIVRPSPFFAPGLDHDVVIQVRDSGIVAVVDHEETFRWSGSWSELSQQGDWFSHVQDKKPVLGIGAVGVPVIIQSISIREVDDRTKGSAPEAPR